MFFIYALLAAFGYALQNTLMATKYRAHDPASMVAYRGLSLGITMLPLLLFAKPAALSQLPAVLPLVLLSSLVTALGNFFAANASIFLPVGIASAALVSLSSVSALALSYLFLGEKLTLLELTLVFLLLLSVAKLSLTKAQGRLPERYDAARGVLHSLLAGIFLGTGYTVIGVASRKLDPFIAGYLWEFSIGVVVLFALFLRRRFGGSSVQTISAREFRSILVAASPTVLGTGLYALSMTLGPIGIATSLISILMVFTTLFGYLFYGERLSLYQWGLMCTTCLLAAAIRLSS